MKCRFVWTQQMTYVTFTLVKRLSKPSLTIQFKSIYTAPKGSRQKLETVLKQKTYAENFQRLV